MEELKVSLPIEDHHRDLLPFAGRSDTAHQVLGDDVPKKRGFAAAGLSQHQRLHDPGFVIPLPGLTMNVVSENDGVLFVPRPLHQFPLPAWRDGR